MHNDLNNFLIGKKYCVCFCLFLAVHHVFQSSSADWKRIRETSKESAMGINTIDIKLDCKNDYSLHVYVLFHVI